MDVMGFFRNSGVLFFFFVLALAGITFFLSPGANTGPLKDGALPSTVQSKTPETKTSNTHASGSKAGSKSASSSQKPSTDGAPTAQADGGNGRPRVWLRGVGGRVSTEPQSCTPTPESLGVQGWGVRCKCGADGTIPAFRMHLAFTPDEANDDIPTFIDKDKTERYRRGPVLGAKCVAGCSKATAQLIDGPSTGHGPEKFDRPHRKLHARNTTAIRVEVSGARCKENEHGEHGRNRDGTVDLVFDIGVRDCDNVRRRARMCFASIGDWGLPTPDMLKVADQLDREVDANRAIRFVISTGDNFYPAGVKSARDPQFEATFERPYGSPRLRGMRWVMSIGNHDQWGVKYQLKYAHMHPRYFLPWPYYGLTVPATPWSNASLFVLDPFGRARADTQVSAMRKHFEVAEQWVRAAAKDAAKSNARTVPLDTKSEDDGGDPKLGQGKQWRVVVAHAPLFSGGSHGQMRETIVQRQRYLKPVRENKVQMWLAGHDHVLEVHRANGTDYFISGGGGGAPQYPSKLLPTTRFWHGRLKELARPGFMVHCLGREKAFTEVVSVEGVRMFTYETSVDFDPTAEGDTRGTLAPGEPDLKEY